MVLSAPPFVFRNFQQTGGEESHPAADPAETAQKVYTWATYFKIEPVRVPHARSSVILRWDETTNDKIVWEPYEGHFEMYSERAFLDPDAISYESPELWAAYCEHRDPREPFIRMARCVSEEESETLLTFDDPGWHHWAPSEVAWYQFPPILREDEANCLIEDGDVAIFVRKMRSLMEAALFADRRVMNSETSFPLQVRECCRFIQHRLLPLLKAQRALDRVFDRVEILHDALHDPPFEMECGEEDEDEMDEECEDEEIDEVFAVEMVEGWNGVSVNWMVFEGDGMDVDVERDRDQDMLPFEDEVNSPKPPEPHLVSLYPTIPVPLDTEFPGIRAFLRTHLKMQEAQSLNAEHLQNGVATGLITRFYLKVGTFQT
ncbi:hypothetical protein HDU97_007615 [Phlyctochytrium planicorne]|nr:hypothetical protein HDU97_007615 [Phlyctochytrium planicorne]